MSIKAVGSVQTVATPAIRATNSAALMPMLAGSLAQLQPVMMKTQQSIEGLSLKFTSALESSEERGRKLEAELIATKVQQAVDKAGYETRLKAQEEMIHTLQKTLATVQKRMAALEGQTKHIRPTNKALIAYSSFFQELDYPGKKEDLALRKPVLQDELAALKLEISEVIKKRGIAGGRSWKTGQLIGLETEAERIAAWEAHEAKAKE